MKLYRIRARSTNKVHRTPEMAESLRITHLINDIKDSVQITQDFIHRLQTENQNLQLQFGKFGNKIPLRLRTAEFDVDMKLAPISSNISCNVPRESRELAESGDKLLVTQLL